jgi:hypothetical protein
VSAWRPIGEFAVWNADRPGPRSVVFRPNLFLDTWGHVAARCIARGEVAYKVAAMYMEFVNSATPVAAPTFTAQDGIDYYNNLASEPDRDYVRVALDMTPQVVVAAGYESVLPPDLGNAVVFAALTGATVGVHGTPFTAGASSRIVGVALAATPDPQDPTADILLARGYYAADQQVPKAGSLVRALYRVIFGAPS